MITHEQIVTARCDVCGLTRRQSYSIASGAEQRVFIAKDFELVEFPDGRTMCPRHLDKRISKEPELASGTLVKVYDRYRFAVPLTGSIVMVSDTNDGIQVKLLQSNNKEYPIGNLIWVHRRQVESVEEEKT